MMYIPLNLPTFSVQFRVFRTLRIAQPLPQSDFRAIQPSQSSSHLFAVIALSSLWPQVTTILLSIYISLPFLDIWLLSVSKMFLSFTCVVAHISNSFLFIAE